VAVLVVLTVLVLEVVAVDLTVEAVEVVPVEDEPYRGGPGI